MKFFYSRRLILGIVAVLSIAISHGQITEITYSGEFTTYEVPLGVSSISIEALGAQGASGQAGYVGGKGAKMYGEFDVEPGSTLIIVVGGKGEGQSSGSNGGGGGGTFVVLDEGIGGPGAYTMAAGPFAGHTVTPLIVAGGGSGTRASVSQNGNPGVVGNMGTSGSGSSPTGGGIPVASPEMGGLTSGGGWGSAGGGFVGNGASDGSYGLGGKSFINGAAGGTGGTAGGHMATGGFGAGGQGRGYYGGGGGGGWSGGGGGRVGGGGASFNIGEAQDNESGYNEEDGLVTIEVLCIGLVPDIPETGVCLGESLTLDVDSETGGTITWSGGVTDEEAFIPPPGTTTYYAYSDSPLDCAFEIDISSSPVPDIEAHSSLPTACEGVVITLWGTGGDEYHWTGTGEIDPIDSVGFIAEEGEVTYTLIGAYLGCEAEPIDLVLVGAPQPEIEGTVSPTQVCLGDGYTVTGGGIGAVSYYWGGGFEDGDEVIQEAAGTFIHTVVGVSEEGCYDTAFVTALVHPNPTVNAGMDVTICEGNPVTLTAAGALLYEWDPEIVNGIEFIPEEIGTTTYSVVGTDINGCSDEDIVNVTVLDKPVIESSIVTPEYFGGDGSIDITVTGGSGEYAFEWSNGAFTEDIYGLNDGPYTVIVNDITMERGMCDTEASFFVNSFVSISEDENIDINIYPNPTSDLITLTVDGEFSYEVTTLLGQILNSGTTVDQESISLQALANGTYLIKVSTGQFVKTIPVLKK